MFNAANASRKRRYTIIPPMSQPETTLAILEVRAIVPIKLIYTKQTSDIADLPDYCTTVIVDMVCRRLIDDFGGQSSESYKKSLDMKIDQEIRLTRNKLNKIEHSIQNMTVKNRLVKNYLDSEIPFDTFVKFR